MSKMKRRSVVLGHMRRFLLTVAGTAAAVTVLGYQLAALAPGLAPGEKQALADSRNLAVIGNNPLFAPHKLLLLLVQLPHSTPVWFVRLPSVLFALAALGLFVYILHRWYGKRSMLFGFLILLCSAWFLHAARFGGFSVDYLLAVTGLLAVHIAVYDHEENAALWFVWLAVNLLLLSVPGMLWFVLVGAIWQFRPLWTTWLHLSVLQRLASGALALGGIAGLAYPLTRHHQLVFAWLGIPNTLSALHHLPNELGQTALALVYRGPHNPELWLGQLPLLDIFLALMFVAGIFFYARHWRATRSQLLAGYTLLAFLLVSLGIVGYSLILPLLYIIAVAGIAYVLHFWLGTFPRNPIARYFGIAVVAAVVATSCLYGLSQYFVAWPHNPEVAAVYRK